MERHKNMKIISKLTDIYTKWCDDNKVPFVSADEQDTTKLTEKQKEWLEEFIEVWDKSNDVESWFYENEVKDDRTTKK